MGQGSLGVVVAGITNQPSLGVKFGDDILLKVFFLVCGVAHRTRDRVKEEAFHYYHRSVNMVAQPHSKSHRMMVSLSDPRVCYCHQ